MARTKQIARKSTSGSALRWRSPYICVLCAGFLDCFVLTGADQEAILAPPVLAAGPGRSRINKAVKEELAARKPALDSSQCVDVSGVCVPLDALYHA
jgi:hypothetical protein